MPMNEGLRRAHDARVFQAYLEMDDLQKLVALGRTVYHSLPGERMMPFLRAKKFKITYKQRDAIWREMKERDLLRGGNHGSHFTEAVANQILRSVQTEGLFQDMARDALAAYEERNRFHRFQLSKPPIEYGEFCLRVLLGDEDLLLTELEKSIYETRGGVVQRFNEPWDPAWVGRQSPVVQYVLWRARVYDLLTCNRLDERTWQGYLQALTVMDLESLPDVAVAHAAFLIQRGDLNQAEALLQPDRSYDERSYQACIDFMRGQLPVKAFMRALTDLRKHKQDRQALWPDFRCPLHLLALLADGNPRHVKSVLRICMNLHHHHPISFRGGLYSFRWLAEVVLDPSQARDFTHVPELKGEPDPFLFISSMLAVFWINKDLLLADRTKVDAVLDYIKGSACTYLDYLMTDIALSLGMRRAELTERAAALVRDGYQSLRCFIQTEEPWRLAIRELMELTSPAKSVTEGEGEVGDARLIWLLENDGHYYINLFLVQQKKTKKGWTKGRRVSFNAALTDHTFGAMLREQDHKILSHVRDFNHFSGVKLDLGPAMLAAVGHPYVYLESNRSAKVLIEQVEPEILVENLPDHLMIKFWPDSTEDICIQETSPTHYKVIQIRPEQRRAREIVRRGLRVPKEGSDEVLAMIEAMSGVLTVNAELNELADTMEMEAADGRLLAQIFPQGVGFKLLLRVRPFTELGPTFYPGSGSTTVIVRDEGKTRVAKRDLRAEVDKLNHFMNVCPTVASEAELNGEWFFDDAQLCLEVLLELENMGDDLVIMWPQGKDMSIFQPSMSRMQVKVGKSSSETDWFEVSGTVKLNEGMVITLKELLKLADQNKGRFVPLGENQFVALTQSFRRRLEIIQNLTNAKRSSGVHALASKALEEALHGAEVSRSQVWQTALTRREEALAFEPKLPRIEAELRPYQIEGFAWMARLDSWGVGACLADDMGLGKTLQALTLMVSLAKEGPMLVVAPTSVCTNWIREAQRFTPNLSIERFGSGDRDAQLEGLGPFKVLVSSYGIMQNEIERLEKVPFRAIVLDEAQAIKNAGSLRAQAAHALKGDFRLLLTGTPLENNLSELWSLFRFLNPGLLGNHTGYVRRFVTPIEKFNDETTRTTLKKMVQPFILRRLKSEVLEDLPARTEITMRVEPDDEESAFYEAVRREALDVLDEALDPSDNHIRILAQIMRLRRSCCHPKLIDDETEVGSAKLQRFSRLVQELIEGRHRALVFSQFVDYLKLLEKELKRLKVNYQYLDGSTPAKQRQKAIDAFQTGDGDIFLISLKAGGTGLNLTAADYVIHMDPWWNPAVEDQASDRAYRIGQKRPVTIYRLVMANTIEEKIVALHARKRDLAESLLEGADTAARMTAKDMLKLLQT